METKDLAGQPHVTVYSVDETTVSIAGLTYDIPRQSPVSVPQQVAEALVDAGYLDAYDPTDKSAPVVVGR